MKPLVFQAIDWYITDFDDENDEDSDNNNSINKKYLIKIFGRTQKGNAISLNITDYTPYFYIKGLDNFPEQKHRSILLRLQDYIDEKLPFDCKEGLISLKILHKKDIWGFTNNKSHKFIRLLCKNYKTMRFVTNIFTKPLSIPGLFTNFRFKLYENNIEPYLRFIHKQDLQVSGWIKVDDYKLSSNFTTKIGYNYDVKWKDVKPYDNGCIAPFIIASFDIECDSFDGSFPQASHTYNKVSYKILEYYQSLNHGKIYTKAEKRKLVNDYLVNLFSEKKLNIIHDYDVDSIKETIEYEMNDIYAILNGKLQYRTEAIINNKKKNLLNYFKTDNDDDEEQDEKCDVSNSEIIKKLTYKFDRLFPKIEGDPIIQIGITTHLYGNKDCNRKVILTLGTCSDIDGIEIIRCPTEKDIITNFVKLINQINPDIITGYNILGFDFDYIYHRARELGCIDVLCTLGKTKESIKECDCENNYCKNHWVKKTLSSSALGDNFLKYINMEGRVVIDLMKEVQRGHNLDTYKLDYVAQHFINGKIKDIKYLKEQNKYQLKVDNPTGIQNGIYIRIGEEKYIVENINYDTNTIIIDGVYSDIDGDKWGLAKDDVSPQDIFECMRGSDDDRAKVARYCIQDCALCNYLMIKLEIVANNIGMSNVCSIPFSYIFLRGQSVKIFSLIAKYCKENNFLIPYQDKKWKCEVCNFNNSSFDDICQRSKKNDEICGCPKPENEGYEGAIVLHPKPGIYDDAPISVLDYASLYPSSMISENISHDTIVLDSKYDNLPGYEYVDITYDLFKGKGDDKKKIGEQTCRFAQFPNSEKGLLPRILQKLLKQRKSTRKKITWKTIILKSGDTYKGNIVGDDDSIIKLKVEDKDTIEINKDDIHSKVDTYNEFQKAVLDGLQLAYKVTANSLYGFVGAPTSQLFMKELAASTTATGRNLIMSAKKFAEEEYNCEVVYGDTDSIFIKLPPLSCYEKFGHETEEKNILQYNVTVGEELSNGFQKLLKPPHCLEWEKMFYPFIIFSKKRYVGNLYEHDVYKFKQKSMGIVLKRRDNANIVKIIYGGIINKILNGEGVKKSLEFLHDSLEKLSNGEYPMDELIVTKTLRGMYKNPQQIAHKVLADRMKKRDPGSAPQSNDRVPYAYIQTKEDKNKKLLQGDKIEDPKFIIENNLTPDYGHYISNQIMKPCLQLYSMVLEDLDGYKHKNDKNYWKKKAETLMEEKQDQKKVDDKIKQLREKEVEELLFSKYLTKIDNKKKGIKTITEFF
jgi:DNA polymerase elongation subunit (family B)